MTTLIKLFQNALLSLVALATLSLFPLMTACQSGGGGLAGNEQGSEPINSEESKAYQKAIVRCYKQGGTRVVKIMGKLRCY